MPNSAYLNRAMAQNLLGIAQSDYPPGAISLSLHTGDPGAAGTANEVTGGSYARKATGAWEWDAGISKAKNSAVVRFDLLPIVTVTYVGYWDDHGNWLGESTCPSTAVASGNSLEFPAGSLTRWTQ